VDERGEGSKVGTGGIVRRDAAPLVEEVVRVEEEQGAKRKVKSEKRKSEADGGGAVERRDRGIARRGFNPRR
jgi:hypothetical protein